MCAAGRERGRERERERESVHFQARERERERKKEGTGEAPDESGGKKRSSPALMLWPEQHASGAMKQELSESLVS